MTYDRLMCLLFSGTAFVPSRSAGVRRGLGNGAPAVEPPRVRSSPDPMSVTVRADHATTLSTHSDHLLLLTDDGDQGRVWLARVPGPAA